MQEIELRPEAINFLIRMNRYTTWIMRTDYPTAQLSMAMALTREGLVRNIHYRKDEDRGWVTFELTEAGRARARQASLQKQADENSSH